MAERKIGRRSGIALMSLGVVRNARVGGGSAVLRQLLGHGPQLRGGDKGALQPAAPGDAFRRPPGALRSGVTDMRRCPTAIPGVPRGGVVARSCWLRRLGMMRRFGRLRLLGGATQQRYRESRP